MTEDKADKALRKVIINLVPQEKYGGPVEDKDILKIDISNELKEGKYYCLDEIKVDSRNVGYSIKYVPFNRFLQFKDSVENLLDATIVNSKQRESLQKLLDTAFYSSENFDAGI